MNTIIVKIRSDEKVTVDDLYEALLWISKNRNVIGAVRVELLADDSVDSTLIEAAEATIKKKAESRIRFAKEGAK